MESQKQQGIMKKHIPWWVHLLLAVLSYSLLKYFLPALSSSPAGKEELTQLGSQAAPIIAIIFLLLAANALYKNVPQEKPDDEADDKLP